MDWTSISNIEQLPEEFALDELSLEELLELDELEELDELLELEESLEWRNLSLMILHRH